MDQRILLKTPSLTDSADELIVEVYYSVSEGGSTELAGIGTVILFDSNQLNFLRHEEFYKADLFQAPTSVYTEKSLYDSLTSAGKTVNVDLDSIEATKSGIPFAYLTGSDQLFDGNEETKWDGVVRWPGANIVDAKSYPGVKLFNLIFKPTADFKDTTISALITTTAEGYTGINFNANTKVNSQSVVTGITNETGIEDNLIRGELKVEDVAGIFNVSVLEGSQAKNGTVKLKTLTDKTPLSGIGYGTTIDWEYQPNDNYFGSDSFTISITDNFNKTTQQKIDLNITSIDDPAVITGNKSGSTDLNKLVKGKLSATDIEGLTDETIFSITSSDYPKNGTAAVNAKTGEWEYMPKENFADNDSFVVTITDDLGGTSKETINVSINSPGQTNIPSEIKLLDDTDVITKNTNPTITGKAETGATVEIFKGEVSFGKTTANVDGLWSLGLTRALDPGSNEFKVYATVGSKLISKASLPLQLILDTTMPVLTISAKDSQGNAINRLYVGQTALLSFKFSEATAANSFTKEDIIASDGVQSLGSITEFKKDDSDPTLFSAILTPPANLISEGSILVSAGSVEDLGGNKNITTLIPFAVITGTSYSINNGVTGDSAPLIQQEGTGTLETSYTFKISRSGDTRAAGNVKWTVIGNDSASSTGRASASDFVDGTMPSGIVEYAAGDTETKTVTIKVKQDSIFELDEIFRVELSDPTSTNSNLIAKLAPGKAVVNSIIINDDAPPLRPVVNNPAFDLIGLTDLRNDPKYSSIDGRAPILTGESTQNYKNFTIAVLDSGVDGSHDRLKYDETHSPINSKDSGKFVGYVDFVNKQSSGSARVVSTSASSFIDNIGHGTHVAGTVGSSDPAIGVATGVQLLGLRVGDESMSYGDIMEALTWVKHNRTDFNIIAVNMSLGGDYYNQRPDGGNDSLYNSVRKLINELEEIGITVVSAAGNDYFSNHTDDKMRENIAIPAIASSLAVGAVWKDGAARNVQWGGGSIDITTGADRIASFSQRLNNYDGMIFAPGAFIPSTVPGNKVENKGGTSMASPIVAGAVALLQDAALTFGARLLSPREITGVLDRTAKRIFDGDDENTNVTATFKEYRRMDLYAAVKQVEAMFKTPTGGGSKTLYYFTYNYGNGDHYSGYGIAKDSNNIYANGITGNSVENNTTTTDGTIISNKGAYTITGTLLGATGTEGDVVITSYFDGDTGAGFAGTVYGGGKAGLGSEAGDAFLASGESYDSSFTPNQEADLVQNAFLDIQKYSFIYRYSNKVAFNVNENTIAAALLDGNTSGFAIVGGADQNLFNIGIDGALSFKVAPNFESTLAADGTNTYHINVKSTETATINGSSQTVGVLNELSLTIIDLNESPNFIETSAIYSIGENTTKIATIQATDPDLADVLAFSIGADSSNLFQIDQTTGELTFKTAPNYEELLAKGQTSFDVSIAVRDLGGLSVTKGLRISVTDVDEFDVVFSNPADTDSGTVQGSDGSPNPPQIGAGDSLSYDGSVRENAANGTLVGISANAIDADATNNVITYSLSDDAGGRFAIDSFTGAVFVANGSLIDFDDQPTPGDGVFSTSHTIKAKATSQDGSFIENSFTIAVENVREDLPFFNSSANIIINENELTVTNFTNTTQAATDPDGQGSPLSYSIVDGRDSNLFEINAANGSLRFKQDQTPNFESPTDTGKDNTYALNIKVTDGSEDVENANITQLVTIRVRDVDEFDASQPTDSNSGINSVIENALPGTFVGITASSIDADATNNLISYSLTDSANDTFIINPLTGVVSVLNPALLDYETDTDKSISITVKATSADGSNALQTFKIDITNVNELFTINTATNFTFSENSTSNIAAISATDQDGTSNYTYKIIENNNGNLPQDDWKMFSVSTTGELSFISTPDYENPQDLDADNTYTFNLEITDTIPTNASGSPISRIEKITIDVTDIVERPGRITGFLGADGKTSSSTIDAELYQGSGFSLSTTYTTSQQVLGDHGIYTITGVQQQRLSAEEANLRDGLVEVNRYYDFQTNAGVRLASDDPTKDPDAKAAYAIFVEARGDQGLGSESGNAYNFFRDNSSSFFSPQFQADLGSEPTDYAYYTFTYYFNDNETTTDVVEGDFYSGYGFGLETEFGLGSSTSATPRYGKYNGNPLKFTDSANEPNETGGTGYYIIDTVYANAPIPVEFVNYLTVEKYFDSNFLNLELDPNGKPGIFAPSVYGTGIDGLGSESGLVEDYDSVSTDLLFGNTADLINILGGAEAISILGGDATKKRQEANLDYRGSDRDAIVVQANDLGKLSININQINGDGTDGTNTHTVSDTTAGDWIGRDRLLVGTTIDTSRFGGLIPEDIDLYKFEVDVTGTKIKELSSNGTPTGNYVTAEGARVAISTTYLRDSNGAVIKPAVDTVLRLFDAFGKEIAYDDDSSIDPDFSKIIADLKPGIYYVGVSGFDNSGYSALLSQTSVEADTGRYDLSISTQPMREVLQRDRNGTLATARYSEQYWSDQLITSELRTASGSDTVAPNHNSITTEQEFIALINVYASSKQRSATFSDIAPFDTTYTRGLRATVGSDTFQWNVDTHKADQNNQTGPHATRNSTGLSFTDAELLAMRNVGPIDLLNDQRFQLGFEVPVWIGTDPINFEATGASSNFYAVGDRDVDMITFKVTGTTDLPVTILTSGSALPMAYVDAYLSSARVYSFEIDKTYTVGFDFYGETVSDFSIEDIVLYDGKVITDDVGTFTAKTFGSNTYFEANFTAKQNLSFDPGQNGVGTLFRIRPANGEPGVGVVGAFDQDQDMDGIYDDNVDTVLRLFNSSGEEIAFSDDYGSEVYSRIDTVLKPGTYTIATSGYGNDSYAATPADLTGKDGTPDGKVDGLDAYVATDRFSGDTGIAALSLIINPQFQADPNGVLKLATKLLISPGEAISLTEKFGFDYNTNDESEIAVRNLRDIDIFRVDTPAEGKLLIDIESDANAPANTHLRFFDSRGVELANNSGGAATDSAGIILETEFSLAAGDSFLNVNVAPNSTYYIGISDRSAANGLNYNPIRLDGRSNAGIDSGTYSLNINYSGALAGKEADNDGYISPVSTAITSIDLTGTSSTEAFLKNISARIGDDDLTNNIEVGPTDVDFYKLFFTSSSTNSRILSINVTGTDPVSGDKRLDPAIELYSLDKSTSTYIKLNENDNKAAISLTNLNDPNRNSSLQVSLAPSIDYYLAVTGSGNTISNPTLNAYGRGGSTGNYNLELNFAPEANRSGRLGGFLNQTVTIGGDINQAKLQGSSPDFDLNLAASLQNTGIKNGETPVELSFSSVGSGLAISGKLGIDSSSSNHPFSALFRAETKADASASVSSDRIGADDVDIFPFSVAQAGAYQLSTRNQGDSTEQSKPTIRLFKADGTELTNGKIAAPAQGLSEQHILTLAAGNYYAVILPTGAATKNFALDSDTSSTATGFQPGFLTAPSNTELQEFNRSIGSYLFEIKPPKLETSAPSKVGTSAKVDLSTPVNSASINVSGANKSATMVRTVAGKESEIKGSVIVDPITNELSFVPTNSLDMAQTGKYEFRLKTSDLKITDGSGALVMDPAANDALQGDPGSNVSLVASTTVKGDLGTITNGDAVKLLYLPSFARGLGQSVDLGGGTGIPISITNADGLRSLKLTFSFDPKNLSIGGAAAVSLSSALTTAGWTISNTNLDLEAGRLSLDLAGTSDLTKQSNASGIELIRIAATVPYSAKFKEGEVLSVAASARSTSGAPVDVMGSSAMQKVALIGDTDGNGNFTSNDSVVIRRLIAGISEGLSAYKSTDPNILSDLDGNGNLTSNDSVTVRRAIAGLSTSTAYSTTPYSLDLMSTNKSSVDPKIRIGSVDSAAGTTAEIPVEVYFIENNVTGLTSYDITIAYTSNTLDLLDSSKETTKQSLASTVAVDFIPTDASIFAVDKLVSYFNEVGSTGTIKLSAAVTDSYLNAGAPIKPSEISESKPYVLGKLLIKIPSTSTAGSTTPLTTTVNTAKLNGILSGSSDPVELTTTEVTSGSIKIVEIDTTAPAFTSGTSATLNENAGTNQLVYTATATDASAITFSIKDGGDKAALAIEATTGKVSLTANPNFEEPLDSDKNNSYLFTVVATDAKGNSAEKAVTLTINDVNEPAAISGDKAATGKEDVVITGTLTAADPEGLTDGTIYSIPSGKGASKGASSIEPASGKWSYTPNANFNGSDSFTVLVTDDKSGTSEQVINVTLSAVDDPASFTGDITATGNEDSAFSGSLTATDVDGLSSSPYSIVDSNKPSNGTATIDSATGKWNYTPKANYYGKDAFTVTVTDSLSGTSTQAVSLTINPVDDPAIFTGDITATGNEDSSISGTLTATDVDSLSSSPYSIADSNKPSNGTATIDSATGKWNYTPTANYHGKDTFTVTVTDSLGGTSTQAVSLTINPVDDPTVVTAGVLGNGLKNKSITGKLVATDVDGLTNSNIYSIITSNGPTRGSATINSSSGEWSYTPRTDEVGQDSFIVTITDDAGFKFAQKIELSVTTDNIKPVITSISTVSSINENNPLNLLIYTATATDDTSPSTAISYELSSNEFSNGTAIFAIDSKSGAVTLNSSLNYEDPIDSDKNNTYDFSIVAKDQAGNTSEAKSLSLLVSNVSLAPTITSSNSVTLDENSSGINNIVYQATSDYPFQLTWGLKGVDVSYFDIGASDGKITLAKEPSTGAIKAFPNYEEKSLYNVTLLANGIEGGPTELPITIAINDINESTQINGGVSGSGDEDSVISATIAATDPEGITGDNAFTITTSDAPKYGTATINKLGYWTYTPKSNYNSIDEFTVTITDNKGAKSTQKISITLKPVPDSPVITGDTSATGFKDINSGSISDKRLVAVDPDDINGLTSVFSLSSTGKPANGTASVGDDGTWAYSPKPDFYGIDSFTIEIKDSTNQITTQEIKVIIDDPATDQKAIITGKTSATIDEDSSGTTGTIQAIDVEGLTNSAVFRISANPSKGAASITPTTGIWSYKPNSNAYGSDLFTVGVNDDNGGVTLQDVTISINPIEDPGNFNKSDIKTGLMWTQAGPNVPITDTVVATDPDGTLNYSIKNSLSLNGASLTINSSTGTWTYSPRLDFTGKDSFAVVATDSFGGTTETNISVLVDDKNTDQPTIFEGLFDVKGNEDTSITGIITATDIDGLGANPYSLDNANKPVNGIATVNSSNGSWSYKPNSNYNGKDSFKIIVTDNAGYLSNQLISLTINPVDDPSLVTAGTKGSGFKNTDIKGKLYTSDIEGIVDGSVYTIAPATGPIRGEASIDPGSGEWKYTPRNNEIGPDSFRVTITDDLGGITYQSIDVNVFNQVTPKLSGATLDGKMSITQISSNPSVQKNVDQMKSKKIDLNPSMIDFTLTLPVNPSKPLEKISSAAVSFNLSDVSAGLTLPSFTQISTLAYYSVDNSTGAVEEFTYDPVSRTGAAFYDTDADGSPDLVTLAFVDGGRGDKDKKVDGKIVDPSTAATTDVKALLASANGLLIVKDSQNDAAGAVVLNTQLTSRSSSVNEIGYVVLKSNEAFNSLSLADLQSRSQVLFAALESTNTPDLTPFKFEKSISLVNGQSIQFFESIDGSLADISKNKLSITDLGNSFKLLSSNVDPSRASAIATSSSGVSFSIKLGGSFAGLDSLIGNQQSELPILDFTSLSGRSVKADITLAREALYNSKFGFYRINSNDGSVKDLTGSIYLPGDAEYRRVALSEANILSGLNNLSVDNLKSNTTSQIITEAGLIAPYAIVNEIETYFSFGAASDDKLPHFKVLGHNVIGFEDMNGGGDKDYDDIIIGFKTTIV